MQWPDLASAEDGVGAALEVPVRLTAATRPLSGEMLSAGERLTCLRRAEGPRRNDWLLGRAALRLLLDDADTSEVAFPHPHLSLTHSAGVAVAVACDAAAAGTGIDFEGWRRCDPRAARFFLGEGERAQLGDGTANDLLRLWTVKEALFKATPANAGGGLLDYRLTDPHAPVGTAVDIRGRAFRYVSGHLRPGRLAVAVCMGGPGALPGWHGRPGRPPQVTRERR